MLTTIDIIILIIIGGGAVLGLVKGFLKQLATVIGLIVGLLAARALYASLAEKVSPLLGNSMTIAQILSFILIWIAVPLGFVFIATLLTKAMEAISLGWVNRLLGAAFGILKFILIISLLINVMEFIDPGEKFIDKTKKEDSVLYYPLKDFAEVFFPSVKQVTEQYIN